MVRDVAQYYFRLRILANASAKAGNYEWESKVEKDSKVIFAPLDVNLDYADFAFRCTMMQTGNAWVLRGWIEEKDLHTRGHMCNYMKGGMAQGEALLKALSDSQIKWGTAPNTTSGDRRRRQRSRSPNKSGKKRKVQRRLPLEEPRHDLLAVELDEGVLLLVQRRRQDVLTRVVRVGHREVVGGELARVVGGGDQPKPVVEGPDGRDIPVGIPEAPVAVQGVVLTPQDRLGGLDAADD